MDERSRSTCVYRDPVDQGSTGTVNVDNKFYTVVHHSSLVKRYYYHTRVHGPTLCRHYNKDL